MARPRKFYFTPYKPVFGRKVKDFQPFVRLSTNGSFSVGKRTLEALGLNRQTFYKVYTDIGRRAVGLVFADTIKPDDGWKAWCPKESFGSTSITISVGAFIADLGNINWPLPRLPIYKYHDEDIKQDFLWFRVPYKDEKVGDKLSETEA